MAGLPMICSAVLDSQLDLVMQSAQAAETQQPEAKRQSGGMPPASGAPPPSAPVDLEEWLLSNVCWDPFDLVRHAARCGAAKFVAHAERPPARHRRLSRPTRAAARASAVAVVGHRSRFFCPSSRSAREAEPPRRRRLPHAALRRAACRPAPRPSSP